MMLHRKCDNAIQMINIGETPMWLNTSMGKFLGQFRTFTIGALGKQTTRDYHMLREGDTEVALAMVYSTATSAMANAARIGFVAATLQGKEREEYLKKSIGNPLALVNQIASYNGVLSAPMDAINLTGDVILGDTWKNVAGSRLQTRGGLVEMVPGVSYINRAFKGIKAIPQAAFTDKEYSKADYRSLYSTLPFSSNYAFEGLNNYLMHEAFKE